MVEHAAQVARAGDAQRAQRQRPLVEVGHHLAELDAIGGLEGLLERHAFGDRALDEDADQALAIGARDQPVRLRARHVQAIRDLALGLAAGEIEPGRARRQAGVIVGLPIRSVGLGHRR